MGVVNLESMGAGNYQTPDGRWKVEKAAKGEWNDGWTVWDNVRQAHADGKPFQFRTKADAEAWLASKLD